MSNDDEIKPGDRFERVGGACFSFRNGDICTALRPAVLVGPEVGWLIEGSEKLWYLDDPTLWRRLPRTEAPSVKVGDIVRDPALLVAGMTVEWACGPTHAAMRLQWEKAQRQRKVKR